MTDTWQQVMLVVRNVIQRVWAGQREVCAIVRIANVSGSSVAIGGAVVNWLMRQNHFVVIDFISL